jgi:hypothetical protein
MGLRSGAQIRRLCDAADRGKRSPPIGALLVHGIDGPADLAATASNPVEEVYMRTASRLVLATFVFAAGIAAGRLIHAQAAQQPTPPPPAQSQNTPASPNILSGNDIGFRVDGYRGRNPVGTLVVRVNGQWVEVDFSTGIKRLTAR